MNFNGYGDLWSYLVSRGEKSIVMYGMGNGADKILAVCERYGIEVCDFFASDGFVRGHSFHSKRVLSYSEAKQKYGAENMIVLLSFASSLPDVLDTIYAVANECELYAPDVPVCQSDLFCREFYEENKEKIYAARDLLHDEESRRIFDLVIKYKLSGDIRYLTEAQNERSDVWGTLIKPANINIAIDAGAYNGDTVRELRDLGAPLKKIYALEPDRRNFRRLSEYADGETSFTVIALQSAAWCSADTLSYDASGNRNAGVSDTAKKTVSVSAVAIDEIYGENEKIDYIKYDVEGSEKEALEGSRKTILTSRPALLVSAYHRSEDIFSLPLMLRELCPRYRFYLRRFPYIPAWDLNIIAIPED